MKMGTAEILKIVSEGKTFTDKVKLLRKYDNGLLRDVLKLAYDQQFVFCLPKGWVPKYDPNPNFDQQGQLYRQIRKIHTFLTPGTYPNMEEEKRKKLFVQFLESIDKDDAELMIAVKDKRLPYKGIYRKIINEAYGEDFLPPARESKDEGEEQDNG